MLLALAWRAGLLGSCAARWRWLAAYALLEIALPFPLIAEGERHIVSSLAAILIATVPMIIALLALRFDRAERVTGRRLVGPAIGFAGVVALVGIDVAGRPDELLGAAASCSPPRLRGRADAAQPPPRGARPARDHGRRARRSPPSR